MTRKIALEEAFSAPSTKDYLKYTLEQVPEENRQEFTDILEDFDDRLQAMDEAGIDIFVLSQTSPGVQRETVAATAVDNARAANEFLYGKIQEHPDRYRGFAHLPLQDVEAASQELTRCVNDFGFAGAMINGNSNGLYLDHETFLPFWETVAKLDVPVYIHPADPVEQPFVLKDYPILQGALWGWTSDNSSHFLRLLFSGLFDLYPNLQIILGHMGETLPYFVWRLDSRYDAMKASASPQLEKQPSDYFRSNLIITTAGVCQDSSLQCAIEVMGEDRVLFSVDYPYEHTDETVEWIENTPLKPGQREKICHQNAERVLKLK
ncbi:MAG TPA: amidohydrolase family protein [Thermoanaerobaculia bacterium]|nr:amidohydrolase family protein [Thermoanaerobaculia bacterium]